MKYIFTSQRVDKIEEYGEIRDSLDERWGTLLLECGFVLIPVPNNYSILMQMLNNIECYGILLTGGTNLLKYGGISSERDLIDKSLIDYAIKNQISLLGVCRGMQSIVDYFGGTLKEVQGHVANKHSIQGEISREVNSYHSMCVNEIPNYFDLLAFSLDGTVEAIRHREYNVLGIMWHPERESPYKKEDIQLIKTFFNKGRI